MLSTDPQVQSNYSVFKEGVKPMWEDVANKKVTLACKAEVCSSLSLAAPNSQPSKTLCATADSLMVDRVPRCRK